MPSNDKVRRHKQAVRLMEINEMLAQIKAVPLHTKESVNTNYTMKHFSIGRLRLGKEQSLAEPEVSSVRVSRADTLLGQARRFPSRAGL